jgi:hypothetical protein
VVAAAVVVAALPREVLPEQAAAVRVLLPIRRPILEARQGAATTLRSWIIRTPVRTPTPKTRTARMKEIKIVHPVAAETRCRRMLLGESQGSRGFNMGSEPETGITISGGVKQLRRWASVPKPPDA